MDILLGLSPTHQECPPKRVKTTVVVLSRAGLVTGRRSGQEVRYALVPDSLDEVSKWIAEVGSRWDERLARLRHLVLEQPTDRS